MRAGATARRATSPIPVVIVGAGFAGIGFGARLREAGIRDFVILERGEDLGGTWRDNTYPGCACDVPSLLYSYSFAPNPRWSRAFATQPEILGYLRDVAASSGVHDHIRFGVELVEARWDEDGAVWVLTTSSGRLEARILISATGLFGAPVIPDVPGIERFEGAAFHSLTWDHGHDLEGERVAVLGTGASAIQFVPEIQPLARRLTVFQRTPPWVLPKPDVELPPLGRRLLALPPLRRAVRALQYAFFESSGAPSLVDPRLGAGPELIGRAWLRHQVRDPELRRELTPDYRLGCKRVLFSNTYLRALTRPNVELVTSPVREITPRGLVTGDGREHAVDTIIFGTGFAVPPEGGDLFVGRDGRTILDAYRQRPQSFLGTTHHGFPNLFQFFGPFSAAGNQSAIFMLEAQYAYVLDAIGHLRALPVGATVEVRADAQEAFTDEMEARSTNLVSLRGGCRSYYTTPDGRNAGLWPDWSFAYRRRTARFDPAHYEIAAGTREEVAA